MTKRTQEKTIKERFDEAFNNLLSTGNRLQELSKKVEYASKLIKRNQFKQKLIKELLND